MTNAKEAVDHLPRKESIVLHDSLSGWNKEIFLEKDMTINLYLCGPTVYGALHIGNLRPVIFFDIIVRVFNEKNLNYKYVQNITDVDDKIIKQAALEGKEEILLTKHYIKEYRQVLKELNIGSPEFHLVTENIEEVIILIEKLIIDNNAYTKEGNVLFNICKNSGEYGKLSKQLISKLSREKGRKLSEQRRWNEKDFVLWKKTKTGVSWRTRWSNGRPGWHSECAAIINKVFKGKTIDIHGGGKDLLFPHHENERIQYIAMNNHELSRIWLHFGLILTQNVKMSKSQGNHLTAKTFMKKYSGNVLRMLLLKSCYSEDAEINEKVITQAVSRIRKIENIMKKISLFFHFNNIRREKLAYSKKEEVLRLLLDNLQTSKVISILEENINFINKEVDNVEKQAKLGTIINDFLFSLEIMGFDFQVRKYDSKTKVILQNWRKLSAQGKYKEADLLRETLQKNAVI